MKVLLYALVASLVLSTYQSSSCMATNPFMHHLSSSGILKVQIFDTPDTTSTMNHCQAEWSTHGTCCDASDLVLASELDGKLIDANANMIVKAVSMVKWILVDKLNEIVAKKKLKMNPVTEKQISDFFSSHTYTNFNESTSKCWDFMKKQRSSALCSMCSGRSSIYFDDGKILVDRQVCRDTTDSCYAFFESLTMIKDKLNAVRSVFLRDKYVYVLKYLQDFIERLERGSPPPSLIQAFNTHREVSKKSKSSQNDQSLIDAEQVVCSTTLNILKTPYIMTMNNDQIDIVYKTIQRQLYARYHQAKNRLEADLFRYKDEKTAKIEELRRNLKANAIQILVLRDEIAEKYRKYKESQEDIKKEFKRATIELNGRIDSEKGEWERKNRDHIKDIWKLSAEDLEDVVEKDLNKESRLLTLKRSDLFESDSKMFDNTDFMKKDTNKDKASSTIAHITLKRKHVS